MLPLLFLPPRGPNSIANFDGGAMAGFAPLDPPLSSFNIFKNSHLDFGCAAPSQLLGRVSGLIPIVYAYEFHNSRLPKLCLKGDLKGHLYSGASILGCWRVATPTFLAGGRGIAGDRGVVVGS